MLTTLKFNLANTAIRHQRLHGRKYLVAPMAMLTEGVHNGSGGPLLYREAECKKAVPAWNMKPIVVYHPQINGQGVSACDPDILESQQIGMVMNAKWLNKLRAEAWIDEELAATVDKRVLAALEENRMMEVSTGLFTDNVGEPGEWNGETYTAEATNHQPDHVAVLPDQIGACSIADGAGLLQLNEAAQTSGLDLTRVFAYEMDTLRRMVGNAMSHSNIYESLSRALHEKYGKETWLVDVYDDFFIYDLPTDKKLYRLDYTTSDAGVEFTGEPQEVIRITEYRTAQGEFVGNQKTPQQTQEKDGMKKEQIVNALIANAATQWGEGDKEALMAMDEAVLNKMAPAKPEDDKPAEPTGNQGDEPELAKQMTLDEYVLAAPPELRDVLINSVATHKTTKQNLIAKITANKANKFTAEFLATKGIQELQGLVALCEAAVPATPATENGIPMFNGAAVPAHADAPVANAGIDEAPLPVPAMDFSQA